jgi:hypothetical protein
MVYIKINSWYGRLGNNIIQVINILHLALYYKYNVILPEHQFIKKTQLEIYKSSDNTIITDTNNFFFRKKIKQPKIFNQNIKKVKEIIRKIFTFSNYKNQYDLIIHIRSGDIFHNVIHNKYISPPLSYYTNIIPNYEKICLVAEDKRNPIINILLEKYPNIIYNKNSLIRDIEIILGARNIISSIGTFVPSLVIFNNKLEKMYMPSYQMNQYLLEYLNNIQIIKIDLEEYKKKINKWKNTIEQKKIMIEY